MALTSLTSVTCHFPLLPSSSDDRRTRIHLHVHRPAVFEENSQTIFQTDTSTSLKSQTCRLLRPVVAPRTIRLSRTNNERNSPSIAKDGYAWSGNLKPSGWLSNFFTQKSEQTFFSSSRRMQTPIRSRSGAVWKLWFCLPMVQSCVMSRQGPGERPAGRERKLQRIGAGPAMELGYELDPCLTVICIS